MGLRGRDSDTSLSIEKKRVEVPASPRSALSHAGILKSQANKKIDPVSPRLFTDEDVDHVGVVDVVDDDDCMWLSSGCVSPSAFFREHRLSSPFNHVADDLLISRLSTIADTHVSLSQGGKQHRPSGRKSVDGATITEYMEDLSGDCRDEPLFWPFDKKIDWNSDETWNYFSMSPRKDNIIKVITNPDQLNNGSKVCNNSNSSRRVRRENIRPSRLRESRKKSAKIIPLDIDKGVHPLEKFLEDDLITLNEQVSIEAALGLGEFDGHEGFDSEFNQDVFILDDEAL